MKLADFEQRFNITWNDIHKHGATTATNSRGQRIRFAPLDYQIFRYHVVGQHSLEATANEFNVELSEVLDLIADLVVRVNEKLAR